MALDFSQTPDALVKAMRGVCDDETHAYFSSYVHKDDFAGWNTANSSLFENFLTALLEVSPNRENCTLQTGGKNYNVHLYPVPSPAREEEPRREALIDNVYFPQEDFLLAKQRASVGAGTVSVPRPS
jgi:hypothetical protein